MATTTRLLAATLALFSSALAFSPDQCNVTAYGEPSRTACNTLLENIAKLGVGNTSYLFLPAHFATPAGISNSTRREFPQYWNTTGCNAALVPINVTDTSVTYDTSTYQDIATVGGVVVQQCISNKTRAGGGWELAGDNQDLVLHLYASGSEIDSKIKQQTSTNIAVTSEDEVDEAELDDPAYDDIGDGSVFADDGSNRTADTTQAAVTSSAITAPPTASPQVVKSSGTFDYYGCELDDADSRTLSSLSWSGTGLTVERCAAYCAEYQYMGLEFASQCYCGGDAHAKGVKPATVVKSATNNCTSPCNGDATQICGGVGWLSVYQNRNSAVAGNDS